MDNHPRPTNNNDTKGKGNIVDGTNISRGPEGLMIT